MPTPNDTEEKIAALKDKIAVVDDAKRAGIAESDATFERTFDARVASRHFDKYASAWVKKVAVPVIVKAARAGYKVGGENAKRT